VKEEDVGEKDGLDEKSYFEEREQDLKLLDDIEKIIRMYKVPEKFAERVLTDIWAKGLEPCLPILHNHKNGGVIYPKQKLMYLQSSKIIQQMKREKGPMGVYHGFKSHGD
jgi:hypothetical protein